MTNIAMALILFAIASHLMHFEIAPGVNLACMIIGTVLCATDRNKELNKLAKGTADIRKLKGE